MNVEEGDIRFLAILLLVMTYVDLSKGYGLTLGWACWLSFSSWVTCLGVRTGPRIGEYATKSRARRGWPAKWLHEKLEKLNRFH